MKKRDNEYAKRNFRIFIRYIILLGLMFTLPLFYNVLIPSTLYILSFLLKLFANQVIVYKDILMVNKMPIQIIEPCVAGSAYLLLLILNITVAMNIKKRVLSIILSFIILFVLNIIRILFFSMILQINFEIFDIFHKLTWYLLSTFFIVGIWFLIVKIFSIKEIPVYSDLKLLYSQVKK